MTRWKKNVIILVVFGSLSLFMAYKYGQNPFTQPIARVVWGTGKCVSVLAIKNGEEKEVGCSSLKKFKEEGRSYEIVYVAPTNY